MRSMQKNRISCLPALPAHGEEQLIRPVYPERYIFNSLCVKFAAICESSGALQLHEVLGQSVFVQMLSVKPEVAFVQGYAVIINEPGNINQLLQPSAASGSI